MERSDMEPWCKICGKPTATAVRLLPEAQAVIEAAKAARLPIEAYMQARGVSNDTITELVVRIEDLLAVEEVK